MGDFIINGKTVASLQIGGKEVIRIADGQTILWEKVTPVAPTIVDYVHTSTASLTANYINTGIYPTTDTVFRAVFKPNTTIGNCIVGFDFSGAGQPTPQQSTPETASSDNADYRLINYQGYYNFSFDFNALRTDITASYDSDGYVDITCGNNYITDNLAQSTATATTQSNMATQNVPIYLNVSSDLDFRSLEIWQNNVKVYDGHAAVLNGTYGVYDSVGGTFTTQTYGGNSMSGGNIPGDYLCFTAEEANSTIGMEHFNTNQTTTQPVLYYSTDKTNWTLWDFSTITLQNVGDKVYFYGDNPNGICSGVSSSKGYSIFRTTKNVACSGDIMTLLNVNGGYVIPNNYCFCMLFERSKITTPPELPATTLTEYCYNSMFQWCYYLTTAPVLPATIVPHYAYCSMFYQCTSLIVAPELPATTLSTQCYSRMFEKCTNLTTGPSVLPATTLYNACYENMFCDCTNLRQAPLLPATTLAQSCYVYMFYNCTSLNEIICLATNITANHCTLEWMNNVSAIGTFYKSPDMLSWTTGTSGIPSGWAVEDYYDCTDCSNWEECGYESYEDCNCQQYGEDCQDCSDCTYWEECGYSDYEDCRCQQYGECQDYCQDCIDGCEGDPDCEASCYECDEPCGEPCDPCADVDCGDCNYWDCCGYESYEDCQCQQYSECPEPVDCTDWENLGYESEEDCNCQEYGIGCPEEEEPEE